MDKKPRRKRKMDYTSKPSSAQLIEQYKSLVNIYLKMPPQLHDVAASFEEFIRLVDVAVGGNGLSVVICSLVSIRQSIHAAFRRELGSSYNAQGVDSVINLINQEEANTQIRENLNISEEPDKRGEGAIPTSVDKTMEQEAATLNKNMISEVLRSIEYETKFRERTIDKLKQDGII